MTFLSEHSWEHQPRTYKYHSVTTLTAAQTAETRLVPLSIRLLALQPGKILLLEHSAVHSHARLGVAYYCVVRHAPAMLAAVECQRLFAPHICLDGILPLHLNLVDFVISPDGAISPADGAEAFEARLTEGWKGDADGFAVASYRLLVLLRGRHGGGDVDWLRMRLLVEDAQVARGQVLVCSRLFEGEILQSLRTLRQRMLMKGKRIA